MPHAALPPENDLSTEALMAQVLIDLQDPDDSELGALVALHGRPTQKVIDWCTDLCGHNDPYRKVVGLRVLRELGHQLTDLEGARQATESVVIDLARNDQNEDVVTWAISCLGYRSTSSDAFDAVSAKVTDQRANVRFSVADALPNFADDTDRRATIIGILTTMADDEDADVRAYALMGLVYDLDVIDEIRPLLQDHLSDPDPQVQQFAQKALEGDWA